MHTDAHGLEIARAADTGGPLTSSAVHIHVHQCASVAPIPCLQAALNPFDDVRVARLGCPAAHGVTITPMCTVVLLIRPGHAWPLLLAANRDERLDRAWDPPAAHWPDQPDVVAGRDRSGGGTWMGVNQAGVVAAVLNRQGSLGPAPGKRSRGELPLLALATPTAAERRGRDRRPGCRRVAQLQPGAGGSRTARSSCAAWATAGPRRCRSRPACTWSPPTTRTIRKAPGWRGTWRASRPRQPGRPRNPATGRPGRRSWPIAQASRANRSTWCRAAASAPCARRCWPCRGRAADLAVRRRPAPHRGASPQSH